MSGVVTLPDNFQYAVPERPERGEYAFPTSAWAQAALGWRVVCSGAESDDPLELLCAEEHVPGYRCDARMQLRRGVFVSELVVRDAHWTRVPLVDALAAPHFRSHQAAPAAYTSALQAAQQACVAAQTQRPAPAELLDALLFYGGASDAPSPLTALAARFPWCLPLSRFVQRGQLRLQAADGAAFLARCGRELCAGPLAAVTGALEADAPFVDVLDQLLCTWLPDDDSAMSLSSGSVQRSEPDDGWLLDCVANATTGIDALRALLREHTKWYKVSPQFVGLTMHCMQLWQQRVGASGNDGAWPQVAEVREADGATPFEALAAATIGRSRDGELRVRAAQSMLEGAERRFSKVEDWSNVARALLLLASPNNVLATSQPMSFVLLAVAHALNTPIALRSSTAQNGPCSVWVFETRDGCEPSATRRLPVLFVDENGRCCVRTQEIGAVMSISWHHVATESERSCRLFADVRALGASAPIRNRLVVHDFRRIVQPDGWLNDECMSELALSFCESVPHVLAVNTNLSWLAAGKTTTAQLRDRLLRWQVNGCAEASLAAVVAQRCVRRVLVPWHVRNNHWALVVLELEARRVDVYDSLRGSGNNRSVIILRCEVLLRRKSKCMCVCVCRETVLGLRKEIKLSIRF